MRMSLADRLSAVVFLALGLAMLVGGYTMDRLEIRQIHPASIPGLVPMILGVLLVLCALLLFRASFAADPDETPVMGDGSWVRLGITAAICTLYALGLVGWLSYFWATFLFTLAFALVFSFPLNGDPRAKAISVAGALALGVGVAFGTSLLFAELFLVRLP